MSPYQRIEQLIRHLDSHQFEQPSLADLAQVSGLSPFHLQRLFAKWAGVTPKVFLKCLTVEHAKSRLRSGDSVLMAALDSGLSGPGRLHDLCVTLESASPGEWKSGGSGWEIVAGFAMSPFGTCLVGEGPRGICHLSFPETQSRPVGEAEIRDVWPSADIVWNNDRADSLADSVFAQPANGDAAPLRAFVRGTDFQVQVWRALLAVPHGNLISYSQLAHRIGRPAATRAVGTAVGKNRIAYLIPCHRVIRTTGVIGPYRWGTHRKMAMVARETADKLEA